MKQLQDDAPKQRTQAWLGQRKGRITASAVGGILGHAHYVTRDDILRRMVREAHGAPAEFSGNIATEYGTINESGALVDYRLETGNDVELVGFIEKDEWAGCSPDGLIDDDGGLEIKCPFGKRKDAVPQFKFLADQPHYYDQVQFSLWVTGRAFWHFFQWAPGGTMLEYVEPDQDWLDENLPRLRQFYAEYLDAIKEPDDHLAPRRLEIDTPEASRMLREWDDLNEAIARAEARKKDLLDEIVLLAKNSNALLCGRKLTFVQKDGAISYAKAVKELAPDADLEKWRGNPVQYWKLG